MVERSFVVLLLVSSLLLLRAGEINKQDVDEDDFDEFEFDFEEEEAEDGGESEMKLCLFGEPIITMVMYTDITVEDESEEGEFDEEEVIRAIAYVRKLQLRVLIFTTGRR